MKKSFFNSECEIYIQMDPEVKEIIDLIEELGVKCFYSKPELVEKCNTYILRKIESIVSMDIDTYKRLTDVKYPISFTRKILDVSSHEVRRLCRLAREYDIYCTIPIPNIVGVKYKTMISTNANNFDLEFIPQEIIDNLLHIHRTTGLKNFMPLPTKGNRRKYSEVYKEIGLCVDEIDYYELVSKQYLLEMIKPDITIVINHVRRRDNILSMLENLKPKPFNISIRCFTNLYIDYLMDYYHEHRDNIKPQHMEELLDAAAKEVDRQLRNPSSNPCYEYVEKLIDVFGFERLLNDSFSEKTKNIIGYHASRYVKSARK